MPDANCADVGTYNPLQERCACPLTHQGASCEIPRLPSCTLGAGLPALRPLFWVHSVMRNQYQSARQKYAQANHSSHTMGPISCGCVRELLQITAPFTGRWAVPPASLVCATHRDPDASELTLKELLESGGARLRWVDWRLSFRYESGTYRFACAACTRASLQARARGSTRASRLACPVQSPHS